MTKSNGAITITAKGKGSTTPAARAALSAWCSKNQKLLVGLYERWLDEKDYEDIADYFKPIKPKLHKDMVNVTMTKKPFGFKFSFRGLDGYEIFVTSGRYGWRRVLVK